MIWKKVKGFENYEVSNTGSVRNAQTGVIVSQIRKGNGRKRVTLTNGEQRKNIAVDKLVADAYFTRRPGDYDIVHINGDLLDSNVNNLSLVRRPEKCIRVVEYDAYYGSQKECCMAIGIPPGVLSECLSGKRRSYKGLHFEEIKWK